MKLSLSLLLIMILGSLMFFGGFSYYDKNYRGPKIIGSFDFFNTKTSVISAGGCTVFMTQFDGEQKPMFYFACDK